MKRNGITINNKTLLLTNLEVLGDNVRVAHKIREAAKIGKQSLYADPDDILKSKFEDNFDLLGAMQDLKGVNALWVKARAIDADTCNANGDYFSKEELLKETTYEGNRVPAYKTFEGVPIHANHENKDITKAKGTVVYAEWDEKNNCVWVIFYINEDAYPDVANGIRTGIMHDVSMGCTVTSGLCSICGHEAATEREYCEHLRKYKGKFLPGSNNRVYEKNKGIKFIELSIVGDGAFDLCAILEIYDQEELQDKALEIQERVSGLFGNLIVFGNQLGQQEPQVRDACEGYMRQVVDQARWMVTLASNVEVGSMRFAKGALVNQRTAQAPPSPTSGQLLATKGANTNETVTHVLRSLGLDPNASLNVLDMLNLALNFMEVTIMQLFSQKSNIDLTYVSKISKAMADVQGTMQDMIDEGLAAPAPSAAGTPLPQKPGGAPQGAPQAPAGPDSQYQPGAVGQSMAPAPAQPGAPHVQPQNFHPLGSGIGAVFASAFKPALVFDGSRRVVTAAVKSDDGLTTIERFAQAVATLAEATQKQSEIRPALAAAGGNISMNLFQNLADEVRSQRANTMSLEVAFADRTKQHRVVISTSNGSVRGFLNNRQTNWEPELNEAQLESLAREQFDRVGNSLLDDFKRAVKASEVTYYDEMDPVSTKDIAERALDEDKRRENDNSDGKTQQEKLESLRKDSWGEKTQEEELSVTHKVKDAENGIVKEVMLEDAGLYGRRDNGDDIRKYLYEDVKDSYPEEHIEIRLEEVRGDADECECDVREVASRSLEAAARAVLAAKVTPSEILNVAEKLTARNDLPELIALAAVGVPARDAKSQRLAFHQTRRPLLGAENALLDSLGRACTASVKAQDISDALSIAVAEKDKAINIVTSMVKAVIAEQKITPRIDRVSVSRKEAIRAAMLSENIRNQSEEKVQPEHIRMTILALVAASREVQASAEEVVEVIAGMNRDDIQDNIVLASSKEAREVRAKMRKRRELFASTNIREAQVEDIQDAVYGWFADLSTDGKVSTSAIATAAAIIGAKPVAAADLVSRTVQQRTAGARVTDENCSTLRIEMTKADLNGLDPASKDFDDQFKQRAIEILGSAGYQVDSGTFSFTDLTVSGDTIVASVTSRVSKTFDADASAGGGQPTPDGSQGGPDVSVVAEATPPDTDKPSQVGNTVYTASAAALAQRLAQMPGGGAMGGGAPAGPGGGMPGTQTGGLDPLAGAPDPGAGVASLSVPSESGAPGTEDAEAPGDTDSQPEPGTKQPWGSICPVCGSNKVTIANGEGNCQSCGTALTFKFMVEAKPGSSSDSASMSDTAPDAGAEPPAGPDMGAPDMGAPAPGADMGAGAPPPAPAGPPAVTASVSWEEDPEIFLRYADTTKRSKMLRQPVGSICPACGNREASGDDTLVRARHKTYCRACRTMSISQIEASENPGKVIFSIKW